MGLLYYDNIELDYNCSLQIGTLAGSTLSNRGLDILGSDGVNSSKLKSNELQIKKGNQNIVSLQCFIDEDEDEYYGILRLGGSENSSSTLSNSALMITGSDGLLRIGGSSGSTLTSSQLQIGGSSGSTLTSSRLSFGNKKFYYTDTNIQYKFTNTTLPYQDFSCNGLDISFYNYKSSNSVSNFNISSNGIQRKTIEYNGMSPTTTEQITTKFISNNITTINGVTANKQYEVRGGENLKGCTFMTGGCIIFMGHFQFNTSGYWGGNGPSFKLYADNELVEDWSIGTPIVICYHGNIWKYPNRPSSSIDPTFEITYSQPDDTYVDSGGVRRSYNYNLLIIYTLKQ